MDALCDKSFRRVTEAVYGRDRFRYGWKKQVKSSCLLLPALFLERRIGKDEGVIKATSPPFLLWLNLKILHLCAQVHKCQHPYRLIYLY